MKPFYCDSLRRLREKHGLKQIDVSSMLGTTQQVYSRYETGINELPLRHLVKLCRFFKVSADDVLGLKIKEKQPCP